MGWVLGGGGARGAYEVGVCDYIFSHVARELGGRVPVDVISGTSVGSLLGCALAAGVDDPRAVMRALVSRWSGLRLGDVLHVDRRRAMRMIRALLGRSLPSGDPDLDRGGVLDARPIEALLSQAIDFRRIAEHIRARRLRAVSVTATHVASGRTTVFFQGAPDVSPWTRGRTWAFPTSLAPVHAMASAAIPFLFPAVRVRGALYCDGSLRQHVPLSPARRMGARALVVVNPRTPRVTTEIDEPERERAYPGPLFLLGKVLNALSLDRIDGDVERLERINRVLAAGTRQFGPRFVEVLNADLTDVGDGPLVPLPLLHLQSSEDLGKLGAAYVRSRAFRERKLGLVERAFGRLAERESEKEADLVSYLLFDGGFARALIDLGRRDAEAQHDRIVAFLAAAREASAPDAAA